MHDRRQWTASEPQVRLHRLMACRRLHLGFRRALLRGLRRPRQRACALQVRLLPSAATGLLSPLRASSNGSQAARGGLACASASARSVPHAAGPVRYTNGHAHHTGGLARVGAGAERQDILPQSQVATLADTSHVHADGGRSRRRLDLARRPFALCASWDPAWAAHPRPSATSEHPLAVQPPCSHPQAHAECVVMRPELRAAVGAPGRPCFIGESGRRSWKVTL